MELFNIKGTQELSDQDFLKKVKKVIVDNWHEGVTIIFQKGDNSLRKMDVKLNESLLAPKTDEPAKGIEARRKTNKARGNLVVTEWLKDTDEYQIRTVPLMSVISVSSI